MMQNRKGANVPKPGEVELEDVVMERLGKEKFRVRVVKLRGVPVEETTLEKSVSLPVARHTMRLWRCKAGVVDKGTA